MNFNPQEYVNKTTQRLERLFFAHPDAIQLFKKHPHVLLLDCTYKTNRFRMPLLNICVVTGNRKTIQVGLCFLSGEKKEDYDWAMAQFTDVMRAYDISEPLSVVTDRELALMNTLDEIFPETSHILCSWHVNMNILANCRQHYPKDTKDPAQVTKANPHGYVPNPKWTEFLKDWALLLDSSSYDEYTSRLVQFRTHQKVAVAYVEKTWLVWKEKLVKFWVDQHLHFGIRVTSPIEGCHAVLKAYLRVSTGDLKGVFDRLLPFWPAQHQAIEYALAVEQNRVKHHLNRRYFDQVQRLVHDRALQLILYECAKLHKAQEQEGGVVWPCKCTITTSHGLPCFHDVSERFNEGGQILPEDIHLFWWYDNTKASTVFATRPLVSKAILEPVTVRGKGRPKGSKGASSKGNGKNDGVTGESRMINL
jgi:hypothetical protein